MDGDTTSSVGRVFVGPSFAPAPRGSTLFTAVSPRCDPESVAGFVWTGRQHSNEISSRLHPEYADPPELPKVQITIYLLCPPFLAYSGFTILGSGELCNIV